MEGGVILQHWQKTVELSQQNLAELCGYCYGTSKLPLDYGKLPLRNSKVLLSSASQVLPFSASAVILPPPLVKPTLRLYMSVLYLQGVLIFMLFQQLIIFIILAFYLFIQVLQRSRFIRVAAIEFLKLIGTTDKDLYRVLGRIQVIAFPTNIVLQRFPYQLTSQYFFNFLFIVAINLNQQGGLFSYPGNRLFTAFYSLSSKKIE